MVCLAEEFGGPGGDRWRRVKTIKCHKNFRCKIDLRNKLQESVRCWGSGEN